MPVATGSAAAVKTIGIDRVSRWRVAARDVGKSTVPAGSSYLSFKLNGAGLIPVVVASWLVGDDLGILSLRDAFGSDTVTHLVISAVLIALFAFVYTSFVLDPDKLAENLQIFGGTVPAVAPGEATAAHLDWVLTRLTTVGAAYLVVVCLLPKLVAVTPLQLPFAGPFLLLAACVTLDITAQARAFATSAASPHS
jgi:preprotein translocase subunit SecY